MSELGQNRLSRMSSASPLHLNEPTSIAATFAAGQCQTRTLRGLFDDLVGNSEQSGSDYHA
jgi:hypothetical protein